MISIEQIERLEHLQDHDHFISSLYLRLWPDARIHGRKLKDLIKAEEDRIVRENIPEEERERIKEDWKRIRVFVETFDAPPNKGLVLFLSSARDVWEVFPLVRPVRDILRADHTAYIRPLTGILDEYRRICTLLVDQNKARLFEIYMGGVEEHAEIFSDVPARVRVADLYGYTERKIERHIDFHLHNHLKKVADTVLAHFRRTRFDWLLIGGLPEIVPEVEKSLHSSLRQRLRKSFRMDVKARPHEVLEKTLEVEKEIKHEEDQNLVNRLTDSLGSTGLGVTGIQETLSSLYEGSVHTLLLEDGFTEEGAYCRHCRFMGLKSERCPVCKGEMIRVPDIIEEAVASAIDQNCEIIHITPGTELDKLGKIGAFLRYKT